MKILKTIAFVVLSFVVIIVFGYALTRAALILYTQHKNVMNVPDLEGRDYKRAQNDLYKCGLYITVKGQRHSDAVLEGSIISQDPPANSVVKNGYTIEVIVSKGPEMVKIPILDNLTIDEAKIRLKNVFLTVGSVDYAWNNAIPKGKIIYTQPMNGVEIPKNSAVSLVVSMGKIPKKISGDTGIYESLLEGLDN